MQLRDHSPIIIDKFNGKWNRGNADTTPLDHFQDCNNLRFIADSAFSVRYGIAPSQNVNAPIGNIKRIYNYPTQTGNTLLILQYVGGIGYIYHFVNSTTIYGPILSISGMTDFAFQPYAGRAYISPFTSYGVGDLIQEKGIQGEYVYIYLGDGTPARKAAGSPLFGVLTIANGIVGYTDAGFHIFGFVSEFDTGFFSAPGALTSFTTVAGQSVSFGNVPVGQILSSIQKPLFPLEIDESDTGTENFRLNQPQFNCLDEDIEEDSFYYAQNITTVTGDPHVVARHLVATKVITGFNGNLSDYQFFFVPNAIIQNNTDNFLNNISFFDADLLEDASYLISNYSAIPAGAVMSTYHNRLIVAATFSDISLALVSTAGQPEAISQISGLLVYPLNGDPITNAVELRDVLYMMKRSSTKAWQDNGGEPATWVPVIDIDNALGTGVHGIGTVLDSGSASVDFLIIATYQGLTLFNGKYLLLELSWKIESDWKNINQLNFGKIQVLNAPIQKEIYVVLPDGTMLVGNYSMGMDFKKIRWTPVSFQMLINTVSIHNIDEIIIGA